MAELTRITESIEELFPGGVVRIGDQQIAIRPLGLGAVASISKKAKEIGIALELEGVTFDNCKDQKSIITIATLILGQFPDILEKVTNIDQEDLNKLPIEVIVTIVDKVVEVNLKSKESLEKNFESLMKKILVEKKTPKRTVRTQK